MSGTTRIFAGLIAASFAGTAFAMSPVAPGDVQFDDGAVAAPVAAAPGDPVAGRAVASDRGLGNCLACHAISEQSEHLFHGEVGPSLDGVGSRWSEAELRGIIINSKAMFSEETIMPGFYTLEVGIDVREDLKGKTILTAQQVEDVVAYLMTLKDE